MEGEFLLPAVRFLSGRIVGLRAPVMHNEMLCPDS